MSKNSVIKLILSAPEITLYKAFQKYFQNLPDVEIFNGYFQDLSEFDCMVSAANSFGLMDGGVDLAIINCFGKELMYRVQQRILSEYLGEQPVGTSMIVETNHPQHPFIAHTPTMRIPMRIASTDHVYLAMWAMLLAVRKHNQTGEKTIEIVVCPGLGTGTGKVPHLEAARQMALAYKNFLNPPEKITWDLAGERQGEIIYGGDMGFKLNHDIENNGNLE
ncbi:macro domain-containing protein [Anabaena sphaerica FACHB-251]|uniref:Macro domain-containing protein n=1 Tax=Anabaena sphaerica FACHB-251 TaxID=2692883 RepID=A0A926WE66_9NOST|nr:macro domain-containing protein [Anabaena sphaerica]MBD2292782.1 macro domain-containing protein [Anabaena sphaerica FACHB-251]